jgi:hypothetical protein
MMIIPRRGTPKLLFLLAALACTHQPLPPQPGLSAMKAALAALRAEPAQWATVLEERANWDMAIDDVALGGAT